MTGAVQHHCDIQTHSISSLLDTITHLTPGTQPRQEPRQPDPATYRQTGSPATRQPGSTRQHPAAPGSAPTLSQPGSTRQHPAAPGSTRQQTRQHPAAPGSRPGSRPGKPGTRQHPATRQTPGNTPATRQPDPATPGNPATRAQDNIQTHYDELLKLIIRAQAPQRQVSSRVLAKGWRVSLAPARKLAIRCHVVDFSRGHFCVRSRCDSDTTALRGSWRAATRLWRAAVRGSRRAATRLWRAATRLEAGRYAAMAGGPLRGTSIPYPSKAIL